MPVKKEIALLLHWKREEAPDISDAWEYLARNMTKKEKRLQSLLSDPKSMRFSELDTILTSLGYERRKSGKGSSHHVIIRMIT